METKTWSKSTYTISTDADLIPIDDLTDVFASKEFYWAKSLPKDAMRVMLRNSLCFGVYETTATSGFENTTVFVGFARCVTDFVTFAYLTDVWIKPTHQGQGLGKWLVGCVNEIIESMPHLRRAMLYTADWERSVPFYQNLMGMSLVQTAHGSGLAIMECKGRGHPSYGQAGNSYT